MPLTPQDVDALFVRSTLDHEIIVGSEVRLLCGALRSAWQERDRRVEVSAYDDACRRMEHQARRAERAEAALSSASATEAALRAEVERITRERDAERREADLYCKAADHLIAREAALRGERDEACEALAGLSVPPSDLAIDTGPCWCRTRPWKGNVRPYGGPTQHEPECLVARAVLARIRKEGR